MTQQYVVLGINPEPWTPSRTVRTGQTFKSAYLSNYQMAIKSALEGAPTCEYDRIDLAFYFWRTAGTKHNHKADATNLQKALEDALQSVLFENDRNVVHVDTWVVEQTPDTVSKIIIRAHEAGQPPFPLELCDVWCSASVKAGEPATEDFNPKDVF